MADPIQLEILQTSVSRWNAWRRAGVVNNPDLSSADLRGADLSSANLSSANLHGADLSEANLGQATLEAANLRQANLTMSDLNLANLRGADLSVANLSGADLVSSNLFEAKLDSAELVGVDLSYSLLSTNAIRAAKIFSTRFVNTLFIQPVPAMRERGSEALVTNVTGTRGFKRFLIGAQDIGSNVSLSREDLEEPHLEQLIARKLDIRFLQYRFQMKYTRFSSTGALIEKRGLSEIGNRLLSPLFERDITWQLWRRWLLPASTNLDKIVSSKIADRLLMLFGGFLILLPMFLVTEGLMAGKFEFPLPYIASFFGGLMALSLGFRGTK